MTFIQMSLGFGSAFFVAWIVLLTLLSSSNGQDPSEVPSISNSVAQHICKQQSAFQEGGEIQAPVKEKPEGDDAVCGWYSWTKCEEPKSNSCPAFVLAPCEEAAKAGRKAGKSAGKKAGKTVGKKAGKTTGKKGKTTLKKAGKSAGKKGKGVNG